MTGLVPSAARTISVLEPSKLPLRGVSVAPPRLEWLAKAPAETLDYPLDVSAWLADVEDGILSVAASISMNGTPATGPTDIGIVWLTVVANQIVVQLSGGTAGAHYIIQLTMNTIAGRRAIFSVYIATSTDTPSAAPDEPTPILLNNTAGPVYLSPNALLIEPGVALLLDNGSPLIDA